MYKTKLNYFCVELKKGISQNLKERLQEETIEIHEYTYRIKQIKNEDNTCKYQLLPIALSSGFRNCFTPIIWIEIMDFDDISNVVVTLRMYTAVSIMLAVFCIGAVMIETALLIYLLYCTIIYRSIFTLEVFKPFVSFLIIPSAMFIAYFFTFRNVRNALLEEIGKINV